jgi:pimeloyl-ACP methyl ester carboxylesterase
MTQPARMIGAPPLECIIEPPGRPRLHTLEWPGLEPAVVLIHPNRTLNRVWDHTVCASRLPNRFLAPSLRGHGLSGYPAGGYKLADHRDDLAAFIRALGTQPVFLVGQATGAMLALMIANRHPDLVRGVVAANPALAIPAAVNALVQSQVIAQTRFASRAQARAALPFAQRWSEEVVDHYLDHALVAADGEPGGLLEWRYQPDGVRACEADLVNDHAMDIRTDRPVLVFGGAEASVLPPAIIDRVCALLPAHRRALLPASDHRLSQDNPAGFAALMDGFIAAAGA